MLGNNFWKKICFLGQFLTLNRMSVSKTTFDNHKWVIWPHLSQKTSFWPDLVCFWLNRGQMTHFYCSKVAFDLLIRFSVKNWPRKHICSQKLKPNPPNWKLVQKTGWDPVWDWGLRSPQKLNFSKIVQLHCKLHIEVCFLGQNELKNRFSTTRKPKSALKCLFGGRSKNGQKSQGIPFEAQNRDFGEAAAPPCVVRLSWKLIWELFRVG